MAEKKTIDGKQLANLLGNCLEAWTDIDRVEITVKELDNNIETIGSLGMVSSIAKDLRNCKTHIAEIHTTLFFDNDKGSPKKQKSKK